MEYLDGPPCQMDDLLDFSSDIGEVGDEDEDDVDHKTTKTLSLSSSFPFPSSTRGVVNTLSPFSGVVEEEELEWISNKDAFPMLESLVDIIPNQSLLATAAIATSNHRSPVSVLENSSTASLNSSGSNTSTAGGGGGSGLMLTFASSLKPPGRARSKCRRKRRKDLLFRGPQWHCWNQENRHATATGKSVAAKQRRAASGSCKPSSTLGRKCQHCQAEKTPQWRAGPMGPKTLCNACGVRYKSGRLVPEYRPAASPTFSTELHSNSHRKIVEMRKKKHVTKENGLKLLESG